MGGVHVHVAAIGARANDLEIAAIPVEAGVDGVLVNLRRQESGQAISSGVVDADLEAAAVASRLDGQQGQNVGLRQRHPLVLEGHHQRRLAGSAQHPLGLGAGWRGHRIGDVRLGLLDAELHAAGA